MNDIERIKCGNGNVYLVSEGDNAILVDTCREQYRSMIVDKCMTNRELDDWQAQKIYIFRGM